MAVFLILGAVGCSFIDEDDVKIETPDSAIAWTPISLQAWIPSTVIFGSAKSPNSWSIKNAGTTRARLNGNGRTLFTMAPGTVTLTLTFKNASDWNKDVVKDFTIRIYPAPEGIHALGTELVTYGINTADAPISVKANIDLEAHWENLWMMLIIADRYVNIDFTGSTGTKITNSKYNNKLLVSVVLPDSVTSIGDKAFSDCSSLVGITIPNSVTSIGDSAFSDCSSLVGITIPNSVTSIGDSTFSRCRSLVGITIPDSVTSIGKSAFRGCSKITSITIPDSVTSIGDSAFDGCWRLETINVNSDNTTYSSIDGIVYNKTADTLVLCPEGKSGIVNIPGSITSIGNLAFSGCSKITSITIPDSITSIGESVFSGCTSLASITIPDSVTSIGNEAFRDCTSLTNFTIPDNVTSIGEFAFRDCSSLASVTIGNSVTSISIVDSVFSGCTRLEAVNVNSGNTMYSSIDGIIYNKTADTLIFCPKGKSGTVNIPGGIISIGDSAFRTCTRLASVTIPNSVTSIGNSAFRTCTRLASVTIPNSVTGIGSSAFSGCSSLASVTIGNSVVSIGGWAFSDCTSLTSITIPNSVAAIRDSAFRKTSLASVTFEGTILRAGFSSSAFDGDLQFKYLATNGGPGTYIRQSETKWSKR